MKKSLKIILSILCIILVCVIGLYFTQRKEVCWPYCPNMTDADRTLIQEQMKDAFCPDEKIINKMPGSPQSSYYIEKGVRRELSEYDTAEVEAKCNVPIQEVY